MPTTAFQPLGERSSARQMKLPGGVVDQDVDVPEVLDRALDHLVDLLRLAHVDLHGQRIEPGVAQRRRSRLEVRRVPAADHDARAERSEALRDREPDSRAAAGDDRDLTLEHRRTKHDESDYRRSHASVASAQPRPSTARRTLPAERSQPACSRRCYDTAGLPAHRSRRHDNEQPRRRDVRAAVRGRARRRLHRRHRSRAAARRSPPIRSSS